MTGVDNSNSKNIFFAKVKYKHYNYDGGYSIASRKFVNENDFNEFINNPNIKDNIISISKRNIIINNNLQDNLQKEKIFDILNNKKDELFNSLNGFLKGFLNTFDNTKENFKDDIKDNNIYYNENLEKKYGLDKYKKIMEETLKTKEENNYKIKELNDVINKLNSYKDFFEKNNNIDMVKSINDDINRYTNELKILQGN